jgi:hypothetical protein
MTKRDNGRIAYFAKKKRVANLNLPPIWGGPAVAVE